MGFTNEDLKRLEEQMADEASRSASDGRFFHEDILALFARLKAAETVAGWYWDKARNHGADKGEIKLLEAWRKACGK